MSKIIAEFDTKEKTLSVTMDGTTIDNVASVEIYPSWDDDESFRVGVTTIEKVDDEDMTKVMRIVAKDNTLRLIEESSDIHKILARRLFPKRSI